MNRSRRPDDDPVPIGDALAAVRAELGMPAGDVLGTLDRRWSDIVGNRLQKVVDDYDNSKDETISYRYVFNSTDTTAA